jgi:transposase
MRKGMATLAMLVQQTLGHDPFSGEVFAFRGRKAGQIKLIWHDGVGMCLFIKKLERGQFIWPMSAAGTVSLTAGQLSTLLEGLEWRATARNLRPELAG